MKQITYAIYVQYSEDVGELFLAQPIDNGWYDLDDWQSRRRFADIANKALDEGHVVVTCKAVDYI